MNVSKKIILFAFLSLSFAIEASVHLEPLAGFRFGGGREATATPGGLQDDNISGFLYGGRVGYSFLPGFVLGLDFRQGNLELDNGASTEYDTTSMGINLSYTVLYMIKVWGTWVFDMEKEISSGGIVGDTFSGSGHRFGVGYKILPYISLNFEYASYSYDELESGGTTSALPSVTLSEVEHKEFVLSMSVPFSFFMF